MNKASTSKETRQLRASKFIEHLKSNESLSIDAYQVGLALIDHYLRFGKSAGNIKFQKKSYPTLSYGIAAHLRNMQPQVSFSWKNKSSGNITKIDNALTELYEADLIRHYGDNWLLLNVTSL